MDVQFGSAEAVSQAASYVDATSALLDYDATDNYAQVIAKNSSGAATGLRFRAMVATVITTLLSFAPGSTTAAFVGDLAVHGTMTVGLGASAQPGNTAIGIGTLPSITTSTGNTAVGQNALNAQTSGYPGDNLTGANTAVGNGALQAADVGYHNTAVGWLALERNTSGNHNIAVGSLALEYCTTGFQNVAVGVHALDGLTTGSDNVAMGMGAGYDSTTAQGNVLIGYSAAQDTTTGSSIVAIGYQAMAGNTTGAASVVIGANAGLSDTGVGNNTILGYQAGYGVGGSGAQTTGHDNIIIGVNAIASSPTVANEATIGNSSLVAFRVPGVNLTVQPTALSFGGTFTSLLGDDQVVFRSAQATTGWQEIVVLNTGAQLKLGIESSGGGNLAIGTHAYAVVLGNADNAPLDFATNNARCGGFDASGNFDVVGALKLGVAYTAGAPSATGYVTLKDSTGTTYKVPVST